MQINFVNASPASHTTRRADLEQGDVFKSRKEGRLLMHTSYSGDEDFRSIVVKGDGDSVVSHDPDEEVEVVGVAELNVKLF